MTCDLWPLLESFPLWLAVNVWIFHKSWFFAQRRPAAVDGEFWSKQWCCHHTERNKLMSLFLLSSSESQLCTVHIFTNRQYSMKSFISEFDLYSVHWYSLSCGSSVYLYCVFHLYFLIWEAERTYTWYVSAQFKTNVCAKISIFRCGFKQNDRMQSIIRPPVEYEWVCEVCSIENIIFVSLGLKHYDLQLLELIQTLTWLWGNNVKPSFKIQMFPNGPRRHYS